MYRNWNKKYIIHNKYGRLLQRNSNNMCDTNDVASRETYGVTWDMKWQIKYIPMYLPIYCKCGCGSDEEFMNNTNTKSETFGI